MKCRKCGEEISDDCRFCNHCGVKVNEENPNRFSIEGLKALVTPEYLQKLKDPKMIKSVSLVLILLVAATMAIFYFNNELLRFRSCIKQGNYEQADIIFRTQIKSNQDQKVARQFLEEYIQTTLKGYQQNNIQFDSARDTFDGLGRVSVVSEEALQAKNKLMQLKISREAFSKGEQYIKESQYGLAVAEFIKVIHDDENYSLAQELIEKYKGVYRSTAMAEVESLVAQNQYQAAVEKIETMLEVIPEDGELLAKKDLYEKEAIQQLIASQELEVVSTSIVPDYSRRLAQVIVRNKTNKTVKRYEVGIVGYDAQGYPVKIGWLEPDYLFEGNAERNIHPQQTYGKGMGWDIDDNSAVKILACVSTVEYYDGTTWINPYYAVWKEKYVEKPL
jgi:tetratricopeptide (TPR) repeat protein